MNQGQTALGAVWSWFILFGIWAIKIHMNECSVLVSNGARTFRPRTFPPRKFPPRTFRPRKMMKVDVLAITIKFGFGICACINV